jgi:hypothetical protein
MAIIRIWRKLTAARSVPAAAAAPFFSVGEKPMTLGDGRCLVRCPNVNQGLMMSLQKPKTPGSLRLIISEPTKTEKDYADPMLPHAVVN